MASVLCSVATAALLLSRADAQTFKLGSTEEIIDSARTLAEDGMTFYEGDEIGEIPGLLPGPPPIGDYWWWEGGAMMGLYVDYWYLTGDDTYNSVVTQGILHHTGFNDNFLPRNYTNIWSNDDQGIWGMVAMSAAEYQFPLNPPEDEPQWLDLASAVFDSHASRWDTETCDGGLRWQIPLSNNGYNYKNTLSTGTFFNLGARLARYNGNETNAKWASDAWDWLWDAGYIDNTDYSVYDGADVEENCERINKAQFSTNSAILLNGAAHMYNYTNGDEVWKDRVEKMLDQTLDAFFPDNIAYELACETRSTCTVDMLIFKGLSIRWLSAATKVAPFISERIMPVLQDSAEAAVAQCTGGDSGRQCGFYWSEGRFVDPETDGTSGAGEALSVLSAVSSLLVDQAPDPVTAETADTPGGNEDGADGEDGEDGEGGGSGAPRGVSAGAVALSGIASFVAIFVSML